MKKDKQIKLVDITKIRFSPEFEFELPKKVDADKLIERGKTLKGWEIKSDASLDNGIELSPENSNKLYYNSDSLMEIKEVLALCRVYRAKAQCTCGLHLHVDVSKYTDSQILSIIREWIHRQSHIAKRYNISKDRLENTCKLLPKKELHKLTEKELHKFRHNKRASFGGYEYLDDKYYSLNVSHLPKGEYETLEFRLFSASTNFREIKSVIFFVLNFIKDSLERT